MTRTVKIAALALTIAALMAVTALATVALTLAHADVQNRALEEADRG